MEHVERAIAYTP